MLLNNYDFTELHHHGGGVTFCDGHVHGDFTNIATISYRALIKRKSPFAVIKILCPKLIPVLSSSKYYTCHHDDFDG